MASLTKQGLSRETSQTAMQKEEEAGIRAGVTGTPACFIHGRFLSRAQPLESLTRVIEDELARSR